MTAFVLTVDYMEADYDGVLVVCASDYGETTVATTGSKAAAYQAFNRYYQGICGEQIPRHFAISEALIRRNPRGKARNGQRRPSGSRILGCSPWGTS